MFQTTILILHPYAPLADMTESSLSSDLTALCDTEMMPAVTHLPCRQSTPLLMTCPNVPRVP